MLHALVAVGLILIIIGLINFLRAKGLPTLHNIKFLGKYYLIIGSIITLIGGLLLVIVVILSYI